MDFSEEMAAAFSAIQIEDDPSPAGASPSHQPESNTGPNGIPPGRPGPVNGVQQPPSRAVPSSSSTPTIRGLIFVPLSISRAVHPSVNERQNFASLNSETMGNFLARHPISNNGGSATRTAREQDRRQPSRCPYPPTSSRAPTIRPIHRSNPRGHQYNQNNTNLSTNGTNGTNATNGVTTSTMCPPLMHHNPHPQPRLHHRQPIHNASTQTQTQTQRDTPRDSTRAPRRRRREEEQYFEEYYSRLQEQLQNSQSVRIQNNPAWVARPVIVVQEAGIHKGIVPVIEHVDDYRIEEEEDEEEHEEKDDSDGEAGEEENEEEEEEEKKDEADGGARAPTIGNLLLLPIPEDDEGHVSEGNSDIDLSYYYGRGHSAVTEI